MITSKHGIDITDLISAIQDYVAAEVKQAKLPRYAESRKIDAIREVKAKRIHVSVEIEKLIDKASLKALNRLVGIEGSREA